MDHGYPESLSSPNGTPLELRGLQPDQSHGLFVRVFWNFHVFQVCTFYLYVVVFSFV
jgi:hypothetical protein